MHYTPSFFAFPLVLMMKTIDAYLFLAFLRLIDRRWTILTDRFSVAVGVLSDELPRIIEEWITNKRQQAGSVRPAWWISWVIVIVMSLAMRHVLIRTIVTMG